MSQSTQSAFTTPIRSGDRTRPRPPQSQDDPALANRRDHAELLLMIAAGHRIVDLASARGVGYDAMRKRIGAASAAAGRALAGSALAA